MSSAEKQLRPRRRSRILLVVAVVLIVAAGAGGFIIGRVRSSTRGVAGTSSAKATATDNEVWYTCGMHPNVLQKGPGECPICHMKLTPVKQESSEPGAETGGPQERKILYWRAPMDPNYISDRPGKSPMGMDLVPVYAEAGESATGKTIRIDPVTIQNMGIRTTTVQRGPLIKTIRTVGRVDYDEQRVSFVDTKFDGWIEKLYVDQTGIPVDRNEPLFDVYSPQLYSAQEEYLAALRGRGDLSESTLPGVAEDAQRLLEAARVKLQYLDVSEEQIEALRTTGEARKTLTILSPASGIVTDKMALEGMYVKPGMRLYTVADLSRVWVYVDVYEYQLPWVHIGQEATMSLPYIPGKVFVGRVTYVYPYLAAQTRVIKVRLEFDNPGLELKPDMYANISLESELNRDALLIPREAYIDSGVRKVAFVDRGGGKFQPRDIQVGVETEGGQVEVQYGLDEGETVVTSGQFMLDAESKLREAIEKMMEAENPKSASPTATQPATRPAADAPISGIPPDAKYACPMQEHPNEKDPADRGPYFSSGPGNCPRCGMTLQPLEELEWVQVQRAAMGGDVAYTCPDHQHVFSEKPGECPRCGRKLEAFKVMCTCPDPSHAHVISTSQGNCPECGRELTAFRGVWLDPTMAEQNVPANPSLADTAAYRCPVHPMVNSDRRGHCTICGAPLQLAVAMAASTQPQRRISADAKFVCPMKECWQFSREPGQCPTCGMPLKPIEQVDWARELLAQQTPAGEDVYVCPMHPDTVRSSERGTCWICGMQLVKKSALKRPAAAPEHVALQMDFVMEHYLELYKLLASDRTTGIAQQALGLAAASEELSKHLRRPSVELPATVQAAAAKLHAAALKIGGTDLSADRIVFVDISAAVRTLVEHIRPDRQRWPKLYIYYCPMSKGDWLQATEEKANPYYGFEMLKCGELQGVE